MIDEYKLIRDNSRSLEVQRFLDNPLLDEAIANTERELIVAWKATPPRDTEGRERCWHAIQQINKIKDYFQSILNDGKLAAAQLKELADDVERRKLRRYSPQG